MKSKTSKTTKKTKSKSSKSKTVKEVTLTPSTTETPSSVTVTTTTTTKKPTSDELLSQTLSRFETNYDQLLEQVKTMADTIKSLTASLKRERKQVVRDVNQLYKKTLNETKKRKPRKPSGFAKPSPISNELCDFLGMPYGTELARTDVTAQITKYIKEQGLQNPQNKKEILVDDKLGKIIQVGPDDDPLTYFNIQK